MVPTKARRHAVPEPSMSSAGTATWRGQLHGLKGSAVLDNAPPLASWTSFTGNGD
jgi:hypothetical protein